MLRRITVRRMPLMRYLVVLIGFALTPALAQERTTRGVGDEVQVATLQTENIGIRPQLGLMGYEDNLGDTTSAFMVGLLVDANLLRAYGFAGLDANRWYIGPSTGLMFGRVGTPAGTFLSVPVNLRAGYVFEERVRVGLHGGTHLTYRSVANSMRVGPTSVGTETEMEFFPNFGGDLDFALSRNVILSFRPDVTFVEDTGTDLVTGTLSVTIPLEVGG